MVFGMPTAARPLLLVLVVLLLLLLLRLAPPKAECTEKSALETALLLDAMEKGEVEDEVVDEEEPDVMPKGETC